MNALPTLDAAPIPRVATHQHDVADSLRSSYTPCCGNGAPRWCVVYTHPQAEIWAHTNLTRIGFVSFLPTTTIQRRDRATPSLRHTVTVPLFSRYLFAQQDNPDHWRPIREAPGVASVITDGKQILYAPAGVVEALQAGEALRRTYPGGAGSQWRPGAAVAVTNGNPFRGHEGVVLTVKRNTAVVLLMLFGQVRQVSVGVEHLVAR